MTPVVLRGRGLDLPAVLRVARDGAPVELAPEARAAVEAASQTVERLVARGDRPLYGITTGTGANLDTPLAPDDVAAFQRRLLLSHSVAIGPRFPADVVRAILVARANALAAGGGGVRLGLVEALVGLLNAGVHPMVPSRGSVGTSDLGPLSHLGLALLGLGEVEHRGERLSGAEGLRRAGLAPLALGPKDALALVNANGAAVGHAALVCWDAAAALESATVAAALAYEGFRAVVSPLDARVSAAHPAPGQAGVAARMRWLLDGSALWGPGAARRTQDPISFRSVPQVHGAASTMVDAARGSVELELNAAADNPLVVPADDALLSNGNFHIAGLALAFDALGLALAQVATLATQRTIRAMSDAFSGLPRFLTPHPGRHTGFGTLQKTLVALAAEIRHLAHPASLDFFPVAEGQEDHATMAPLAVRKTAELVARLRELVAIELIAAAQAVDLRGSPALGRGTRAAYAAVRAVVPRLDEDRVLGPDVEAVAELLASGRLLPALPDA